MAQKKNSIPDPVMQPIRTWLNYTRDAQSLVDLTYYGLGYPEKMLKINEILDSRPDITGPQDVDIEKVRRLARLKKRRAQADLEASAGFPTLHAHTILGLWGALECLVSDLSMEVITNSPSLLGGEPFSKVKMPVSMAGSDIRSIVTHAIDEASRQRGSDLSDGVGRFEKVLTLAGLVLQP